MFQFRYIKKSEVYKNAHKNSNPSARFVKNNKNKNASHMLYKNLNFKDQAWIEKKNSSTLHTHFIFTHKFK